MTKPSMKENRKADSLSIEKCDSAVSRFMKSYVHYIQCAFLHKLPRNTKNTWLHKQEHLAQNSKSMCSARHHHSEKLGFLHKVTQESTSSTAQFCACHVWAPLPSRCEVIWFLRDAAALAAVEGSHSRVPAVLAGATSVVFAAVAVLHQKSPVLGGGAPTL